MMTWKTFEETIRQGQTHLSRPNLRHIIIIIIIIMNTVRERP
jgi:hypothetical protein